MKQIFTLLTVAVLGCFSIANAQVLLNEQFDYPANRPLILNPLSGEENIDELTGWRTQKNSRSAVESLNIVEGSLNYEGMESVGNAVSYDGTNGAGFFKLFDKTVVDNETIYLSFLINFEEGIAFGNDYFLALKMETSASSSNWGGRIYAMDNEFTGDIILGINKLDGETQWLPNNKQLKPGETYFIVMRYDIGSVTETPEEERDQSGNFDDVMYLFVNPDLTATEPEVADLKHEDPDTRDIRRWGASKIFGGAAGIFQRTPEENAAPKYTIDAIRAGHTWGDVVPTVVGLPEKAEVNLQYNINNKMLYLNIPENSFSNFQLINLAGQTVCSGSLTNVTQIVNLSEVNSGIYLLNLTGKSRYTTKVIVK